MIFVKRGLVFVALCVVVAYTSPLQNENIGSHPVEEVTQSVSDGNNDYSTIQNDSDSTSADGTQNDEDEDSESQESDSDEDSDDSQADSDEADEVPPPPPEPSPQAPAAPQETTIPESPSPEGRYNPRSNAVVKEYRFFV